MSSLLSLLCPRGFIIYAYSVVSSNHQLFVCAICIENPYSFSLLLFILNSSCVGTSQHFLGFGASKDIEKELSFFGVT